MFPILILLVSASQTLAHRVVLFAYVEGDRVCTESYFSDGKRCQNSRIEVYDNLGNKLLEGKTDKKGEFSFKPPTGKDLRIVLTASMGHRDEYIIPEAELPGGTEWRDRGSEPHEAVGQVFPEEKGGEEETPSSQLTRLEMEQIRAVVEEALDEKMKPIMRLLEKRQKEGGSFIGVIGGIGFIFGIMGIILYFKSRRVRKMEGPLDGS
jgi:nickel transport protein